MSAGQVFKGQGQGPNMKASRVIPAVALAAVLPAFVVGCSDQQKAPVLQESEREAPEIETLPELGDPIGPLDRGRVRPVHA